MNFYQFIGLDTDQKAKYIPHAVYQATRLEDKLLHFTVPYQRFFAEVYFDVDEWAISHIHGFRSRSYLNYTLIKMLVTQQNNLPYNSLW